MEIHIANFNWSKIKSIEIILTVFIVVSIGLGINILLTDEHIYEHAPSHAYTLMLFTGAYATILFLKKQNGNLAIRAVFFMSGTLALLMNLDILTASNIPIFGIKGLSVEELYQHLYGSFYFDFLLVCQLLIFFLCLISKPSLSILKIKSKSYNSVGR